MEVQEAVVSKIKRHHRTIIIIAISVTVLAVAYFVFLFRATSPLFRGRQRPEGMVITYTDQPLVLDPESSIWDSVEMQTVHLVPQSARVAFGKSERDIRVGSVRNDTEVAFLIEIDDDTEDLGGLANPDSCAIMLVPANAPAAAQMMGYESKANIWQWSADRNAARYQQDDQSVSVIRELVAEGPTTQRPLENEYVEGRGWYDGSTWRIIFKRKLRSLQADEHELRPGAEVSIVFAAWNGSEVESFSRKSISNQSHASPGRGTMKRIAALFILMVLVCYSVTGDEQHIELRAERYSYSPNIINVNRGDEVTIRLVSTDVTHGFFLDGYDITLYAAPGDPQEISFTADKSGKFSFRCAITCGEFHPYMIGYFRVAPNTTLYAGLAVFGLAGIAYLLYLGFRKKDSKDRLFSFIPIDRKTGCFHSFQLTGVLISRDSGRFVPCSRVVGSRSRQLSSICSSLHGYSWRVLPAVFLPATTILAS